MSMNDNRQTVLAAFYAREAATPYDVFLVQPLAGGETVEYTWAQVGDESRRVAAYLRSLDLPENSNIALISSNCAHWFIADLAIWMAGYVSVPIYPVLTAASVRPILEHCDAKAAFIGKLADWGSMAEGVPDTIPQIGLPLRPDAEFIEWESLLAEFEPLAEPAQPAIDDLATIIYTSGTTGDPKGVMHSFRTLGFAAENGVSQYDVGSSDRLLSYLPLAHVAERAIVEFCAIYAGAKVYFVDTLETFAADLARARPTIFFGVPRIWEKLQAGVHSKISPSTLARILRLPWLGRLFGAKIRRGLGLDQARLALSGAAPISPGLLRWYSRLGLPLLEGYGMTENAAYSHGMRPDAIRIGTVGQAQPGVDVRLGPGDEILVRSDATMLGYYRNPEATRECLDEDGFLHTGDAGAIDDQGFLRITGRVKDSFKTAKGKFVVPAPIEARLMEHPDLEQVCVLGRGLPAPLCLCVLGAGALDRDKTALADEFASLLEDLNAGLEKHERLAGLVLLSEEWNVENGCLTPTLKVKRPALESRYGELLEKWSAQRDAVIWADG